MIKEYKFLRTDYSDTPGWETDEYIGINVDMGPYYSERSVLLAVLLVEGLFEDFDTTEQLLTIDIEKILLDNNVYVSWEDE